MRAVLQQAELLRNAVACPALAIGFAALAQRPGKEISLLQEWQFRRLKRSEQRSRRRIDAGGDAAYMRQLSGKEEQG